MSWINAVKVAFSTYTRLPMPYRKWDDEAMKLALAFLPLVGVLIGVVVGAWQIFCLNLEISAVLFAALTVAIPIFISGGIHLDGYCDTCDALACWQNKERRWEILKDPHMGAFALIRCNIYLLLSFALLYELYTRGYAAGIGFIYILSRCCAAWSALILPPARQSGMLTAFTASAASGTAGIILALFSAAGLAGWLWFSLWPGLAGLALCLPATLWYRAMVIKNFGGVTGDTTGYYLQTIELLLLAGLLMGGLVAE